MVSKLTKRHHLRPKTVRSFQLRSCLGRFSIWKLTDFSNCHFSGNYQLPYFFNHLMYKKNHLLWKLPSIEDFWKLGSQFSLDGVSSHSFQWRGFEENILQFSIRLLFLKFIKNNFLFRKLIRKLSERKIRLSPAINKTNL